MHVCIDDASRLAYREILPDEKKESAIGFLDRALAWLGSQGISVERVMTDNGSAYRSKAFRAAVTAAGARHKRTRPYTPRTNGKAERFIQTGLREWAYAQPYASSQERRAALTPWLHHYNTARPHAGLAQCPPAIRLNRLRKKATFFGRNRTPKINTRIESSQCLDQPVCASILWFRPSLYGLPAWLCHSSH